MSRRKPVKAFVLDCSATVAWFFEDEADPYAELVLEGLEAAAALVPALWPLEVANALLVGERRKRTSEAKVTQFLALLQSLPITVDDQAAGHTWAGTLHLARSQNLSAYDAAYLEIALRRGLPLATLDGKLKGAAVAVGVPSFAP